MSSYQSYTNESDDALAAQLDAAKLGAGPQGGNSWAVAQSGWDMANEDMTVQKIMANRAALGQASMGMRKDRADDQFLQRESNEFNAFNEEFQNLGLEPDDFEGRAQEIARLRSANPGNKKIQEAAASLALADDQAIQGRSRVMQMKGLDREEAEHERWEAQRPQVEEAASLAASNYLEQQKLTEETIRLAKQAPREQRVESLGKVAGSLGPRQIKLGKLVSVFGAVHGGNDEIRDQTNGLIDVLGAFSKSESLDRINLAMLEPHGRAFDGINKRLVAQGLPPLPDFRNGQPVDEEALMASYASALSVMKDEELPVAEAALAAHEAANLSRNRRERLQQNTEALLTAGETMDFSNPETKRKFTADLAVLKFAADQLGGEAEQGLGEEQRKLRIKAEEREVRKEEANIERTISLTTLGKSKMELERVALEYSKVSKSRDDYMAFVNKLIGMRNSKLGTEAKKVETPEQAMALRQSMMDAYDKVQSGDSNVISEFE